MYIILKNIKTTDEKFDGLLTETGLMAMKYCDEFECEHNKDKDFKEATSDRTAIDELIKKWDNKRIEMLHLRKEDGIAGGYEQSKIIEEALKDFKSISRADS